MPAKPSSALWNPADTFITLSFQFSRGHHHGGLLLKVGFCHFCAWMGASYCLKNLWTTKGLRSRRSLFLENLKMIFCCLVPETIFKMWSLPLLVLIWMEREFPSEGLSLEREGAAPAAKPRSAQFLIPWEFRELWLVCLCFWTSETWWQKKTALFAIEEVRVRGLERHSP